MAKSGPASQVAATAPSRSSATRSQLVDAAVEGLVADGFVGASARSIAQRAGLNQGLVFYHFGSVANLLLAALDQVSEARMEAYGRAVADARGTGQLVDVAATVFEHDLDAGYVRVLAEMIAGAGTSPVLRAAVAARLRPWFAFTEAAIDPTVTSTGMGDLVPAEDLAYAIVALFLGLELLSHLDGDRAPAARLFGHASRLATVLSAFGPGTTTEAAT